MQVDLFLLYCVGAYCRANAYRYNTDGASLGGQRENSYEFVLRIDGAFGLAFSVFFYCCYHTVVTT